MYARDHARRDAAGTGHDEASPAERFRRAFRAERKRSFMNMAFMPIGTHNSYPLCATEMPCSDRKSPERFLVSNSRMSNPYCTSPRVATAAHACMPTMCVYASPVTTCFHQQSRPLVHKGLRDSLGSENWRCKSDPQPTLSKLYICFKTIFL